MLVSDLYTVFLSSFCLHDTVLTPSINFFFLGCIERKSQTAFLLVCYFRQICICLFMWDCLHNPSVSGSWCREQIALFCLARLISLNKLNSTCTKVGFMRFVFKQETTTHGRHCSGSDRPLSSALTMLLARSLFSQDAGLLLEVKYSYYLTSVLNS